MSTMYKKSIYKITKLKKNLQQYELLINSFNQ